jgi:hypothetical protein
MKLSPFRMMRRRERKRREMLVLLVLKPQKERERVDQLRRMMMTNRMRISMWNKVSMKMMTMKMTMNRNKNKKRHLKQNLNKTILNLSKISRINNNHNKIIKTNPSPSLNRTKHGTIKAITTSHSRRTSISIKTKAGPSPKTDLPASHP